MLIFYDNPDKFEKTRRVHKEEINSKCVGCFSHFNVTLYIFKNQSIRIYTLIVFGIQPIQRRGTCARRQRL